MAFKRKESAPTQPTSLPTHSRDRSRMTVIGGNPLKTGIELKGTALKQKNADGSEVLGLGARLKASAEALGLLIRGSGRFKFYQSEGPETVSADGRGSGVAGEVDHRGVHFSAGANADGRLTIGYRKKEDGTEGHGFDGTFEFSIGTSGYAHSLEVDPGTNGVIRTPHVTITYET